MAGQMIHMQKCMTLLIVCSWKNRKSNLQMMSFPSILKIAVILITTKRCVKLTEKNSKNFRKYERRYVVL
jgi:hypothetical protein